MDNLDDDFKAVSEKFTEHWTNGKIFPNILRIYSICNPFFQRRWEAYRQTLGRFQQSEQDFHETPLTCDIMSGTPLSPCKQPSCGICGITCAGMDPYSIRSDIKDFQRFGRWFYLASNSSKCDTYADANGHKGMLLCDVLPGNKFKQTVDDRYLQGPPPKN